MEVIAESKMNDPQFSLIMLSESAVKEILTNFNNWLESMHGFYLASITKITWLGQQTKHSVFRITIVLDWQVFAIEYEVPIISLPGENNLVFMEGIKIHKNKIQGELRSIVTDFLSKEEYVF